jgi:hypothetical protein
VQKVCAVAQVVSRRLIAAAPGSRPGTLRAGFMVDRMALGQVLSEISVDSPRYLELVADSRSHLYQRTLQVRHKSDWCQTEHDTDLAVILGALRRQDIEHGGSHGVSNIRDLIRSCYFENVVDYCW